MVSFRFCPNCSNSLYPVEDHNSRVLLFVCRYCHRREPAQDTCVYRSYFGVPTEERSVDTNNIAHDPTFPRADVQCPKCSFGEAVFFQSRSKRRDASMKLFFVCTNPQCQHRWVGSEIAN